MLCLMEVMSSKEAPFATSSRPGCFQDPQRRVCWPFVGCRYGMVWPGWIAAHDSMSFVVVQPISLPGSCEWKTIPVEQYLFYVLRTLPILNRVRV